MLGILWTVALWGIASGVKIRVLDVPQMAQVGHTVHLTCDYDLERQRLYQVKWYKGSHEFYRYSPGEHVKKKSFLVKNLNIDLHRSDEKTIVLRNLHVDMSGSYTCEVSTEGIFETVKEMAKMTVIALPRGGPHIQGVQQDVQIGDYVNLNCTSLKSKPAANLTFYINGRNATDIRRVDLVPSIIINEEREPHLESSILSMHFKIRKHHVRDARIEIRCEATILNIYQRSRLEEIFVKTHSAETLATPNNEYSSGSPPKDTSSLIFIILLVLATQFVSVLTA